VRNRDQMKAAVCNGQRPALSVLKGPDTLLTFAAELIQRSWHQNPDHRPEFFGTRCTSSRFTKFAGKSFTWYLGLILNVFSH